MRPFRHTTMSVLLALWASAAQAQVIVNGGYVRAAVPGQKTAAVYMHLRSENGAELVGVSSPVARTADIHNMQVEGGVMKMRAVGKLALPAGKTVELKPGGYHIMLVDLNRPLRDGDTVPVTLRFEDSKGRKWPFELKLPVKAASAPVK